MNKARRKEIDLARAKVAEGLSALEEAKGALESARDEEQDYLNNMPESFQNGEKGQTAQEAIDNLVERLRRDRRHTSFEVRDERFVAERSFPEWSMEMVRVSRGYHVARSELASLLPPTTSPAVREVANRMLEQLSAD